MSDYIDQEILKRDQLRVLHDRNDAYINLLTKAALKHIENFIDRPLGEVAENGVLPEDLWLAAMLLITDSYQNRSAQSEVKLYVNEAVQNYMLPYRKMGI